MDKYFKTEDGKIVDIIKYSTEVLSKYPNAKIHIGSDSQVFGPVIYFTSCIVFRYGTNGAHCIYKQIKKDRPPRSMDMNSQVQQRLLDEVYLTMELVSLITENTSLKIEAVEFDFNDEEMFISNKLINLATGWVKGLNLTPLTKSDYLLACKYADHKCKK